MTRNREVDLIRLKEHLKALRLPTIQAECAKLARECLAEGVDHLGFLLKLCELELIERLCGPDSAYVLDLRSSFASAVLDRLVLYQRETHDNAACLPCLDHLQGWPLKTELLARIQEVRAIVGQLLETMLQTGPQAIS